MPVVIDGDERGDCWSSGHQHLTQQGRLGEIKRDLIEVKVVDERGQVLFRLGAKRPRPTLRERITGFFQ